MAARLSVARLAAAAPSRVVASSASTARCCAFSVSARRMYSSEEPAEKPTPPLLLKLRADLKQAMKDKDKARLTVLRGVMAATLNASKTANPVDTNAKVVSLLRRTAKNSEDAVAEFKAANRQDLVEKEQSQIDILNAYADSEAPQVDPAEVEAVAQDVIAKLQAESSGGAVKAGEVIKTLLAAGGPLEGKSVDRAGVALIVKKLLA